MRKAAHLKHLGIQAERNKIFATISMLSMRASQHSEVMLLLVLQIRPCAVTKAN